MMERMPNIRRRQEAFSRAQWAVYLLMARKAYVYLCLAINSALNNNAAAAVFAFEITP